MVFWDITAGVSLAPAPNPQRMKIENHILEGVQFKQTPNISGLKIVGPRFLILHYTASGNVPGTVGSLTRKGGNKSAHLVIGRDGEVVQLASFDQRAWHCGQSEWKGLESLNYYSIGIEFVNWGDLTEDKDGVFRSWAGTIVPAHEVVNAIHKNETIPRDWQDFTPAQLAKGAEVARAILEAYPSIEMILGHDDIAPTRKTDPGPAFPMNQFLIDCGFMDAPVVDLPEELAFSICSVGVKFVVRGSDAIGLLSFEEARALRDWLTKILPE